MAKDLFMPNVNNLQILVDFDKFMSELLNSSSFYAGYLSYFVEEKKFQKMIKIYENKNPRSQIYFERGRFFAIFHAKTKKKVHIYKKYEFKTKKDKVVKMFKNAYKSGYFI